MKRLYLYLASKSKKGIKVITVLQGESIVTSKLENVQSLNLPELWEKKIQQVVQDNKMLYDPWIESAKNFDELKQRLKGRGYSDLPMGLNTLLDIPAYGNAPKADTSSCKIKKTMIRKTKA